MESFKQLKLYIIVICAISINTLTVYAESSFNSVRKDSKVVHLFAAAGEGFSVGTVRLGRNDFEFGLYPGYLLGIGVVIGITNNLYSTLSVGYTNGDLGCYGGLGVDFWRLWILNFRAEIGGVGSLFRNNSSGHALLGLDLGF
ncbi:MAG: hypothetical protein HQK53_08675 [Oligoflexia bacterium]|nr:hypothetical protein [Oligoflexia bacterium]